MNQVIRTSEALCFDECPKKYKLQYLQKIKSRFVSSNLIFGTIFHKVFTDYVLEISQFGFSKDLPSEVFLDRWDIATSRSAIDYSANWQPKDVIDCGYELCKKIPDAWGNSGLTLLRDDDGFAVERRLTAKISDDLTLSGQPDFVVINKDLQVGPLDLKTTISDYSESFLLSSEQLTDYQILIENNAESLGLDDEAVSFVGFIEAIKRKKPKTSRGRLAQINPPSLVERRDFSAIDERVEKLIWINEDIRNGRFPKRPKMAYNSPCEICQFRFLCHEDSPHGLIIPDN